jgi:hypothetical protein
MNNRKIKICCKGMNHLIKEAMLGFDYYSDSDRFCLIEHNAADDGDGYIDTWENYDIEVNFCPICGKQVEKEKYNES